MSKKTGFLILLLAGLAVIYLVYFTDLFRAKEMQISARPRIERSRRTQTETATVSFSFDRKCAVTELKVVAVADAETNKYPHALWNVVAEDGAVPMKGFAYGEFIKGMKPKVEKLRAKPLSPQIKYRLFVEAEGIRGQLDFEIPEMRVRR